MTHKRRNKQNKNQIKTKQKKQQQQQQSKNNNSSNNNNNNNKKHTKMEVFYLVGESPTVPSYSWSLSLARLHNLAANLNSLSKEMDEAFIFLPKPSRRKFGTKRTKHQATKCPIGPAKNLI